MCLFGNVTPRTLILQGAALGNFQPHPPMEQAWGRPVTSPLATKKGVDACGQSFMLVDKRGRARQALGGEGEGLPTQ